MHFPIRTEIEVLPADKEPDLEFDNDAVIITSFGQITQKPKTIGFFVYQKIGIGIINPRGISKLRYTT